MVAFFFLPILPTLCEGCITVTAQQTLEVIANIWAVPTMTSQTVCCLKWPVAGAVHIVEYLSFFIICLLGLITGHLHSNIIHYPRWEMSASRACGGGAFKRSFSRVLFDQNWPCRPVGSPDFHNCALVSSLQLCPSVCHICMCAYVECDGAAQMKNNSQRWLAVSQSRLNYSQSRSIPSLPSPLLVVNDSANYYKGEHALNTVFSSSSLVWGCSRTPTQALYTHTHTHTSI